MSKKSNIIGLYIIVQAFIAYYFRYRHNFFIKISKDKLQIKMQIFRKAITAVVSVNLGYNNYNNSAKMFVGQQDMTEMLPAKAASSKQGGVSFSSYSFSIL